MSVSALDCREVVRAAVVDRLLACAEHAILDDDWDGAIDRLCSVLEVEPGPALAKASRDHFTAPTSDRAAG